MNKAGGGDGIPVELFQILKYNAANSLNLPANVENSAVAHKAGKSQFSFQTQRKEMSKNVHTMAQLNSSHRLAK